MKKTKKLALRRTTLRNLTMTQVAQVGGALRVTDECGDVTETQAYCRCPSNLATCIVASGPRTTNFVNGVNQCN